MLKQLAAMVISAAAVAGMSGLAAPASAADDASAGGNPAPWVMPDVRGSILQSALNSVLGVTGDVDLDLRIQNRKDVREVINYTNWEVCAQSPSGGSEISQKNKRVILVVRRPGTSGCT